MEAQKLDAGNHKPFLNALRGEKQDHPPFWFMRQAGRYLPEYRELRADKGGFLNMVYDPKAAAEITLQPIRRFGMDAAILFSDILVIPHALGQHLEFQAGEGPQLEPVTDMAGLKKLSLESIDNTLSPIYQTLRNIRSSLTQEGFNDVTTIGFAGSPWTVACYMVEGQGSKDYLNVKMKSYQDPAFFEALIDLIVEATGHYLVKQVEAGAEALQLFDSWSGALDAEGFARWSIEPTRAIVEKVKAAYPDIPIIGFPRGAGIHYETYARKTGVDALGLDPAIDTLYAAEKLQSICPVQGNLEPAILMAGGEALEQAARKILDNLSTGPFIFNLGHGIHKDTPISHVERLIEIIRR